MKIAHFSDIHGHLDKIFAQDLAGVDVVVNSGDFMPNVSRGETEKEIPFQAKWFEKHIRKIVDWLDGRPFVSVMGNHDYFPFFAADWRRFPAGR